MIQAQVQAPPAPSQTPAPPQAPAPAPGALVPGIPGSLLSDPTAVYEAFRQQRRELSNQLERLEQQRRELSEQLRDPMVSGADKKGLEQRISALDARIAATEQQLAEADGAVARAAAVPGAVQVQPPQIHRGPPEEFFVLTGLFMIVVLLPLTIAYARRIWRRGAAAVTALPQDIYDRFTRLEHGLDSIAVEVERIGEGQRYLTRMYTDRGLGAGRPEPIPLAERDRERDREPRR